MKQTRLFGWSRWATIVVALALAAFAVVAIPSLREPVLRAAGWALVVNNEPVAPADVIVLPLVSGDGGGVFDAADLVRSGVSERVAVLKTLRAERTLSSSAEDFPTRMQRQGKFVSWGRLA